MNMDANGSNGGSQENKQKKIEDDFVCRWLEVLVAVELLKHAVLVWVARSACFCRIFISLRLVLKVSRVYKHVCWCRDGGVRIRGRSRV